ncbi:hypothetical protein AXG93_606s1060 [Marchantia polymorpha subsp. ruderalis]|uniref:Uncharacterized protein n=1 Tax=Marchantia polymorpha subsp. ruderalis TaxID=1480154 RepID=A0A176VL26_MARPO|nr:hypothetical protein AXG93_606s1060 [Marchantia polymorpha subsp. ruderalis]
MSNRDLKDLLRSPRSSGRFPTVRTKVQTVVGRPMILRARRSISREVVGTEEVPAKEDSRREREGGIAKLGALFEEEAQEEEEEADEEENVLHPENVAEY